MVNNHLSSCTYFHTSLCGHNQTSSEERPSLSSALKIYVFDFEVNNCVAFKTKSNSTSNYLVFI